MLSSFSQIVDVAKGNGRATISVAMAQDREALDAVKAAHEAGLVSAILVGDESLIEPLAKDVGLTDGVSIINEPDVDRAALVAARLVRGGEADILMKGKINSSNFLRGALDTENGLRSGKLLCHLAVFDIPGATKLTYYTDGGMNIAPDLEEKRQMLTVATEALRAIGIERPNVALLAANEQVNPKMQATVDAQALVEMWKSGAFQPSVVEGPIAMDVALSADAARHKGIESRIAGNVDLFLVPTIEVGNIVGKALVHYAGAKVAGVIIGATHPIVLTSRSDSAEAKLHSIALASLLSAHARHL